jgi:hypothetical protein
MFYKAYKWDMTSSCGINAAQLHADEIPEHLRGSPQ